MSDNGGRGRTRPSAPEKDKDHGLGEEEITATPKSHEEVSGETTGRREDAEGYSRAEKVGHVTATRSETRSDSRQRLAGGNGDEALSGDQEGRARPGRRSALKYGAVAVLALALGAALWFYVFPWVMTLLPENF